MEQELLSVIISNFSTRGMKGFLRNLKTLEQEDKREAWREEMWGQIGVLQVQQELFVKEMSQ